MKFTDFFRRHMVLWALLTGFFLGAVARDCGCDTLDVGDMNESASNDTCMDNPTLCAMPHELHNKMVSNWTMRQINELQLNELQRCVDDPGCELLGVELEEYEKLKVKFQ